MLAIPGSVKAQTNWANIFFWSVINGKIYMNQYLDTQPPPHPVNIPSTINGLPVVGLGLGVFRNVTSLTAVTIPDSITYIGDYVFSGCSSLTSLTIPDSVNTIGIGAFASCVSVTNLSLGTNVATIGAFAF
jgi:hypothetical protein